MPVYHSKSVLPNRQPEAVYNQYVYIDTCVCIYIHIYINESFTSVAEECFRMKI